MKILLIFLQISDSLLILHGNSSSALNLIFQLMYCLFKRNFVTQQLLNFPHAIPYDQLQLLLLQIQILKLTVALFISFVLFRSH